MSTANLRSRLTMDDAQFNRTAKNAEGRVTKMSDKFQKSFSAAAKSFAGIFAGAVAIRGLNNMRNELDRIGKLSSQLNISAEAIQRIGFVARQNGGDMELYAKALNQAASTLGDPNNKLAAEAAAALNIEIDKFLRADAEKRLQMLADAFANMGDRTRAQAELSKILGRTVTREMIPALQQGGDAVRELANSISVMSNDAIKDVQKMNDEFDRISTTIGNFLKTRAVQSFQLFSKIPELRQELADTAEQRRRTDQVGEDIRKRVGSKEQADLIAENARRARERKEEDQFADKFVQAIQDFENRQARLAPMREKAENDRQAQVKGMQDFVKFMRQDAGFIFRQAQRDFNPKNIMSIITRDILGLRPVQQQRQTADSGLTRFGEAFLAMRSGGGGFESKEDKQISLQERQLKLNESMDRRFEKMESDFAETRKLLQAGIRGA